MQYEVFPTFSIGNANYNEDLIYAVISDFSIGEISVCSDLEACNYQEGGTETTTCEYPEAYYDCDGNCLNDSNENDVCDELETTGCEDPDACNYIENPFFVVACDYPVPNYDCTNSCINDTNANGVCDEEEIFGCTVLEALNYNPLATYNGGSCMYSNYCEVPLLENPGAGYNMTLMLINLSSFPIDSEYFTIFARSSESGLIVGLNSFGNLDQTVLTIFGDDVMTAELDGATNREAIELQLITNGLLYTLTPNISVNYENNGFQIIEDFTVTFSCSVIFTGCGDYWACNFNPLIAIDDGSCIFPLEYYDCSGNCLSDIDGDEVCDENEIEGCTDEYALNFEKGGAYDLSIYSAIGAVVYQDKLSALETKVNTVNLPNGLYLIKLTKEKYSYTQKIRIQH